MHRGLRGDHTCDFTRDGLRYVGCGRLQQFLVRNLRDGAHDALLFLSTVTYYNDFFQHLAVFFQGDVERCFSFYGNLLCGVAYIADLQYGIFVDGQYEFTVQVRNCSVRGSFSSTLAPMTVSPVPSVTTPLTCLVCAQAFIPANNRIIIGNNR